MVPTVSAVIGLLIAAGWFLTARQIAATSRRAHQSAALERTSDLVDLLRQLTQARVKADAQLLAEDPRLKSTLSAANVDEATILDILQDLQKLNGQGLIAVLSATGRVDVVLGAAKLKGLDLSTSAVVKAALGQEGAALGTWMVDDRIEEIAVTAVRTGDRVVALLVIGARLEDAALARAAKASGSHLGLLVEERTVWSDEPLPDATWQANDAQRIEVKGSTPPARYVAVSIPAEEELGRLTWAVPLAALLFAVLAFWRGGSR
jgi:hypothetical protein